VGDVEEGCGLCGAQLMKNGARGNSSFSWKVSQRRVVPEGVSRDPALGSVSGKPFFDSRSRKSCASAADTAQPIGVGLSSLARSLMNCDGLASGCGAISSR
jgi:hypothetical protein